ncbi:hypothetical protein ACFQZE_06305 [Paenibacillus sp. GCM10027627]|uniref:hypothetical protein n=1 Tax=unclassified Paenibacillus TaxID=185978 RepID=UPI00363A03FF
MQSRTKQKSRIKIDIKKQLSDPKQYQIDKVLSHSLSQKYDDAKSEWELINALDETSEDFTNVCGLCNNPHLVCNFVIHNPHTNVTLHVGSTCIIRFGLIKGNVDVESGKAILKNFVREKQLLDEIRGLVKLVMIPMPEFTDLNEFLKAMKTYFVLTGTRDPNVDQLGEIVFGSRKEEMFSNSNNVRWLLKLWESPDSIPVTRPQGKVKKDPVYKEGSTWGHKKRRGAFISDSFGRSREFNVQKFVEDKKENK